MSKQAGRMSQGANDFLTPYAPTIGTATNVGTGRAFNNGAVSVTFTPTGPNAATSFTVTASTGQTATGASSPIVVTGIATGATPTFTVTGTNAAGVGPASAASSAATVTTVPAAPTIGTATNVGTSRPFNNGAISVTFTAPANGGSEITSYTASGYCSVHSVTHTASGASSPIVVTGFGSGVVSTITVIATNANGSSTASSASNSVTVTTVPAAPGSPTATNNGQNNNRATWTAPANGGSAITSYTVNDNGGGSPDSVPGITGLSYDFTGQTSSHVWNFTVYAINANGTSAGASSGNITTTPFSFTPFSFTPFGFTPFGFTPFGFTPFGFTPFGFAPAGGGPKGHKSVSSNTLIKSKNPQGFTPAIGLKVGDTLYSANITDVDTGNTLNSFNYGWQSTNIQVDDTAETTVMGLTAYFVDEIYVINSTKYSETHFILIKTQDENNVDVIKFERVTYIKPTDSLWSNVEQNWTPITSLEVLQQRELVVCVNVEPYDVFFIEGDILVHDSQPLEHIKQYAVSAPGEDLTDALLALYNSVIQEEQYIQDATAAVEHVESTMSADDLAIAWTKVLVLEGPGGDLVPGDDAVKQDLVARLIAVESALGMR